MIRINLLPIKHDRRKEAGRNHIIIGVLAIVVELVVAMALSFNVDSEISEQKNKNASVKADIERIKKTIAGHDQILKEIAEYEKRQAAIEELQAARTGPVHVMLEISRILSKGGRPTIDDEYYQEIIKKSPARGYDENWDYRRIWINSFDEKARHVTIRGQGVTHEDVAEFLRRINLSAFFVSSELVSTKLDAPAVPPEWLKARKADSVVSFTIVGDVRYR